MIHDVVDNQPITPAESVRHEWQVEENRLAREYDLRTREMELAIMRMQAQWGAWLNIPKMIILLPLYLVLGLGFVASSIRGVDPGEKFWQLIKEL